MRKIEKALENAGKDFVLFISDPVNGDQFVFNRHPVRIPDEADFEVNTADHFLNNLDFEAYEEEPTILGI